MNVYIKQGEAYSKPLVYILNVMAKNKGLNLTYTPTKNNAAAVFDHTDKEGLPVNDAFFNALLNLQQYNYNSYFKNEPYIHFELYGRDYLATAFYMLNAFQEYSQGPEMQDRFGRYLYSASYQYKYHCIEQNIVQLCFDKFCEENSAFQSFTTAKPTRVFLSHDVDTIHGSFLQDGLWAIKKGRADVVLKLVMNELMRKPGWTNIDQIVKLHDEHDVESTFFWLATQRVNAANGVKNADYTAAHIAKLAKLTQSNGIHKSAAAHTFKEELAMLPFDTKLNRYHFLKFSVPQVWNTLDEAGIALDGSLGFAEHYGFRNSYGQPFKPYNTETGGTHNFVEVPLNIMDGTLARYMNVPLNQTANRIINFIEANKENCILSLLWHNTHFTHYKYGGYLAEYKKILLYMKETGLSSITPTQIIAEYNG